MKWDAVDLYPSSGRSPFIAGNLGRALQALEDETAITYLFSSKYSLENELAINPLDSDLAIRWPISSPLFFTQDSIASGLRALLEYESNTKE